MELDQPGQTASVAMEFSPAELHQFQQAGFVMVRELVEESLRRRMLDVTLDDLSRLVEPLEFEADLHYPGAPESQTAPGGRTVRRLKQALSRNIVFTEWVQHPPLVARLKQLLGPKVVCPLAHHNCVMTKQPRFSSDTGWHQDLRYWSFARPDLVSVWLALGPERTENGCLQLIPGSHRQQYPRQAFDEELFFRSDVEENQRILESRILAELNPGDVLCFHAKALHSATRNFTNDTKYSVVFTFRALDNEPLPGSRLASMPELLIH